MTLYFISKCPLVSYFLISYVTGGAGAGPTGKLVAATRNPFTSSET